MKIPKHIDVYGKRWTIGYKWNLVDDNGQSADGTCCKKTRSILLHRMLTKDERPSVFLHELLHAILFELKMGQTNLNDEVEEIIVTGIEEYLIEKFTLRFKK